MKDPYDLQRFLDAQANTYPKALEEIQNAQKQSHWMWFIFPQIQGLGHSAMAEKYAIKSQEEAMAYYQHPILGKRLKEITQSFLSIENKTAREVLGSPDDLKMKSCMTLFDAVQSDSNIFSKVLEKFYAEERDEKTLRLLSP